MGIKRTLFHAAALAALIVPSVLVPSIAGATTGHGTDTEPGVAELLVSGLEGASGGGIGPDGALYVAEGTTGDITRIDPRTGDTSTFATGLPKAMIGLGGVIDVAFVGETAYALVTVVGPDAGGNQIDGIYRIDGPNTFTVIADLGEYSRTHPPATEYFLDRGVQFALQPVRGGFLVSDGHHNRVLSVSRSGEVSELIAFGNIVPTGLAVADKTVYLAEAGPVPHNPADGKVVSFPLRNPGTEDVTDVASGFSLLVDVEFGRCGVLYALSQGDSPGNVPAGSPALPNSGELLRVNDDGTFSVVTADLNLPTSVDFVRDTALVVTHNGEVWKIRGVSRAAGDSGRKGGDCRGHDHGADENGDS
ncbi:sugar lactone lactonase YvrE [Cryobacterium sp. MP_M5]|uniref:ScyD/ScyE family protein n=1 Tax=unclassified Cryobacterium TaxID=2649013 RepID=UPI0018CA7A8F|nr:MULTISPECIES: ScyD/ScyE family protein [unclassified Cryobacterium]MBG6059221.1 sugar lactone lactonase YvrE [Cryobacterium sp. MP_M3]MEC5177515.1 sugar lactone lactonase YvrE [Cryobacterium sp. MP_M5]